MLKQISLTSCCWCSAYKPIGQRSHCKPKLLPTCITMRRLVLPCLLLLSSASAFLPAAKQTKRLPFCSRVASAKGGGEAEHGQVFPLGTIVEFKEKNREHVGKIIDVERKSDGSARYEVEEFPSGKHFFSIAGKEVSFTIPAPTNDKQADKLLKQLEHAHAITEDQLSKELDLTPELLEMAWEEAAATDSDDDQMTPNELVELVHSHKADHIEKYEAWRLLRSEIGHIFFKEIKEHGRVVAFKAKPRHSVEASKDMFRNNHMDDKSSIWTLNP